MKRITLNFIDGDLKVPMIKFTSSGKEFYVILDTGAESSVIEKSILNDFPEIILNSVVEGQWSYASFSGDAIEDVIISEVQMCIETDGGEKAFLEFDGTIGDLSFVSGKIQKRFDYPMTLAMIAGIDFLTAHKAKMDIAKRTVSLLVKTNKTKKIEKDS